MELVYKKIIVADYCSIGIADKTGCLLMSDLEC